MENPPHDRAPPELPEDVVREILTRVPPDDPSNLFRSAAVSRPWLRIVSEPLFRSHYMEFHGVPPVAGLLVGHLESTTFVPMTTLFVPHVIDFDATDALDARHGRVLLFSPAGLSVWDPVLDVHWDIPLPVADTTFDSWTATVLCGDANCAHLDCHGPNFLVVAIIGNTNAGVTSGRCYSLGTDVWTDLTSVDTGVLLNTKPAALVEQSLFFTTRSSQGRIVRYDFRAASVSLVQPPNFQPVPPSGFVLLPAAAGGRLLLASIQLCTVDLWEMDVLLNGRPWVHRNAIAIMSPEDGLRPGNPGPYIVGFCERHRVLYFMSGSRLFSIDVDSGRVVKFFRDVDLYSAIPYLTFHATAMVPQLLAGYLADG